MMRSVRVLCVTPYGLEGRGGIDRLYYYLRQFYGPNALAGIELGYFAARGSAPGALWPLTFPWRVVLFIARMALMRPDLVHLNFAIGGSVLRKFVLLRIAKLFGARTVVHFHGSFTSTDLEARTLVILCTRELCRRADMIVVLGKVFGDALMRFAGVAAERVRVVPNGIPDFADGIALPKQSRKDLKLLFAGLVGDPKGVDVLISGLALLAQRTEAWACVIAGNGEVARFEAFAHKLSLRDRVRFTGWVDADEVHRLAREADVVLLPSRSEALPLTLLEGACAGAALVATPVGEVPEIVHHGVNGLLIDADPGALAAALEHLIVRREELAGMQVAARRIYLERFQLQAFATALRALYLELAEARVPKRARASAPRPAIRHRQG